MSLNLENGGSLAYSKVLLLRPRSACGWGFAWSPLAINLEYLAAVIEKDVDEVRMVNLEFEETDMTAYMKDYKPDIVGISMCAVDHSSGLGLCRDARKLGIPTVVGGYHPTAIPDEMMTHKQVDMIVRGEGEVTFRELVNKGSPEGIEGMTYRRNGKVVHEEERPVIKDLDTIPFPARHLRGGGGTVTCGGECDTWLKIGGLHRDQVHFSRGCWGKCTFCNEPTMSHSVHRYRSPENTMEEIREIFKYHDEQRTLVLFGDPHFMGRPKHVERLCDLLHDADLDMIFSVMIRSDVVAKNPKIVKKMIDVGIVGSCMGIESPKGEDLAGTSKGVTSEVHLEASRVMRRNHGIAGGTFVIGLPGQTEEEILTFPEYARHLGHLNTGYAIATPLPGTQFYKELDDKGLIDDHDYNRYDQMHSVWKHDKVGKKRLEQLVAICVGRFYAPDVFIDDMVSERMRDHGGRKATLASAIDFLRARWAFVSNAGPQFQPEESKDYGALFLRSMANPFTRKRLQMIGVHNMMELGPLLKTLGDQKLQITVTHKGEAFIHFTLKTTKDTVEYLDITREPHPDATLHFTLDMMALDEKPTRVGLDLLRQVVKQRQMGVLVRGAMAGFANYVGVTKSGKPTSPMTLPKKYLKTGYRISGWGNGWKVKADK